MATNLPGETTFQTDDGLSDSHILNLSERIISGQQLLDLGIHVLKLRDYVVDAALYNNKTEIQEAAHKILRTWLKKQRNRREAYTTLYTALGKNEMNELAGLLQQWVEGKTQKPMSGAHSTDNRQDRKRKGDISGGEELTDPHIVLLSKNITSENELVELCVTGLKLKYTNIKTALTNHPRDITSAAHDVLHTWAEQQTDRTEALKNLLAALEACGLNLLADELKRFSAEPTGTCKISPERIEYLQELTKQSLRSKPFCLAQGKEWTLKPSMIHLKEIYTDLSWIRKHRKAYEVEKEDLKNITQILNEEQLGEDGPVRILVQAGGGMGKSTAMKHLALCWADGTADELKDKFQFVFHIALKHVKSNITIEEIIIAQHNGLKANNVKPAEIKAILQGQTSSKVLLLVDGHDEYKCGINTHIDKAIEKESLWNCWMVVTSRETEQIKNLKQYMDAEAEIRGFDANNIAKYVKRALGSEEKTNELLKQAESRNIYHPPPLQDLYTAYEGLMTIPFLLHMICVLFLCQATLPETRAGIMQAIVDRCIHREAIRAKGQKAVDSAKRALYNLGKLAWQGLNEPGKRLIFDKEEVIRVAGEEALELGLLFGTERMSMQEEETDVLCFPHLLFQEFVAAIYISQQNKAELEKLFPTWESILNHEQLIRFACAIAENDALLDVICGRAVTDITAAKEYMLSDDYYEVLEYIKQEMAGNTNSSFDPLHNAHVDFIEAGESGHFRELSRVYVVNEPQDILTTGQRYQCKRILYRDSFMSSRSAIANGDTPVYYAIDAKDPQDLSCALQLIQKIREQIHITRVSSPCMLRWETDCNSNSVECQLSLNGNQAMDALKLVQEINKFQKMSISDLKISGLEADDGVLGTHVIDTSRLNIKSVEITHSVLKAPHCQYLTQLLYGYHKPEASKHTDSKIATQGDDVKCSALEILKMGYVGVRRDMVGNLIQAERLTRLRGLYLLQIDIQNCLGGMLGAAFPSLEELALTYNRLSKADVSNLAQLIRDKGLLKLKYLNLEGNDLTDCLGDLLSTGLPSLETLYLQNTRLSKTDVSDLSKVTAEGGLLKLKNLNLLGNTLTDCLGDILSTGLPSLEGLNLEKTWLSKTDVSKLIKFTRDKSSLKTLILTSNTLTDCLGNLLGTGLPSLEQLDLEYTKLSKTDVSKLSKVAADRGLLKLKELVLSSNDLSDCLGDLPGARFPSLEKLDLSGTRLSKTDLSNLAVLIGNKGLFNLKELDLSWSTLTDCLGDLLGVKKQPDCPGQLGNDPQHPGFPCLEDLNLHFTKLSRDDYIALSTAVQGDKLPQLNRLDLSGNSFYEKVEAAERLVQSCVDYYTESQVELVLPRWINRFITRMQSICKISKITIKAGND